MKFEVVSMRVLVPQVWPNGELIDPTDPYMPQMIALIEANRLLSKSKRCKWNIIILD